jgi:uncharacterized membrane protein YhaH (DUF805 family)
MQAYLQAWKKYAVFDGRAPRAQYWLFALINTVISGGLVGLQIMIENSASSASGLVAVLWLVFGLATAIPGLAVSHRRLHDIDRSGWWLLLALIPMIGWFALFIMMLQPSQPGANQYGPNPHGVPAKRDYQPRPTRQSRPARAQTAKAGGSFEFTNPRLSSNKPLTDLEGIVLLAPPAEAERIARSDVFIGTVQDTAGDSIKKVRRQCPIVAVGHPTTETLFEFADSGSPTVTDQVVRTAIEAAELHTAEHILKEPPSAYEYCVRAMPSNERTGSPFLVVFAYS